jgi:sodium/potassium-transporting ATPase subunit alpha
MGDIILINNGDIRVIKCSEMKVDNSSLTGESDNLVRKDIPTHENVLETVNFAFFGTKCVNGNGTGLVCGT